MALQPSVGPWLLFQFLDLVHSRQASLDGGSACHKATNRTHNSRNTQTSKPQVGFEPTIPVLVRAKIHVIHALDRATTAIGSLQSLKHCNLLTNKHTFI
jgi:hypothetical protein